MNVRLVIQRKSDGLQLVQMFTICSLQTVSTSTRKVSLFVFYPWTVVTESHFLGRLSWRYKHDCITCSGTECCPISSLPALLEPRNVNLAQSRQHILLGH